MTEQRNIRLLVEYDGTAYGGWQIQENVPTVQGCLRAAVERMTGRVPTLTVAGRTDAGVHAVGQVASFKTRSTIEARRFAPGLNAHLPNDISVHRSTEEALDFNPKRDSKSKRYRYRVYCGPQPAALEGNRAWMLRTDLNVCVMQRAADLLLGERDFNAFRSAHCDAPHAVRAMYGIDVTSAPRAPIGTTVEIVLHANAFCRHMCRIISGTLVEVGRGQRTVDSVAAALESRDRSQAGVTAPPGGLTLLEVLY